MTLDQNVEEMTTEMSMELNIGFSCRRKKVDSGYCIPSAGIMFTLRHDMEPTHCFYFASVCLSVDCDTAGE